MLDTISQQLAAYWHNLDETRVLMLWLGGLAVAITALEGIIINRFPRRERYDWAAFWTTIRINGWRLVVEAIPMGAVLGASIPFGMWCYEHRVFDWAQVREMTGGVVLMWVAMFLTTEFFYYWMHRAGHRIRWYWASHQVHHSGNQYNLAAAFRQSITGKISGAFIFFAPQCLLGFPPEMVALSYGLNLVYQFWIHTDLVPKLGWMEGIFNTPSAHRVHHAANVEYLDANYGGTILLFDRLFGTYVPEKDNVPIRYGLVKQVTTYNALWICLFEWANIFKDVGRALKRGHVIDALGYMVMPPGWAPNGQGMTTEGLRAQMKALTGQAAGVPPESLLEGRTPTTEELQAVNVSHAPAR
ncbi:MAG TPA: sterol desaturase family protein [Aquabacterium sp.]|uniref:sterol desaturase family protein n=1 Tax=Aquabacterium sp. TaxID=1872578 RepID=UPI002E307F64|nr:sterol desaturase family protein [Aquabacterium sp.]HEX5373922.1 sterol desaturase family protein [Aquabacterium sp.]